MNNIEKRLKEFSEGGNLFLDKKIIKYIKDNYWHCIPGDFINMEVLFGKTLRYFKDKNL